jgi:transposase
MIQITPQMRILVAIEPVDGRKGIDSLARLCQEKLQADPFSGCLFLFRSRRGSSIRILVYDGQGFWLAGLSYAEGERAGNRRRIRHIAGRSVYTTTIKLGRAARRALAPTRPGSRRSLRSASGRGAVLCGP